jgi:DNA-binding NarL/FixJ family response regulator
MLAPMHTRKQTVAILSDQTLFREGLREILNSNGFGRITQYGTTRALLEAARTRPPDIVVIDLDHEREDVVVILRALRRALLDSQILVIGSALRQAAVEGISVDADVETPVADSRALVSAAEFGVPARLRSPEALRLRRRWSAITPRQRDVLRWMSTGADNGTIARHLRVSERAVKAHVSTLLETFALKNRAQLSLLADHAGLRPLARSHA